MTRHMHKEVRRKTKSVKPKTTEKPVRPHDYGRRPALVEDKGIEFLPSAVGNGQLPIAPGTKYLIERLESPEQLHWRHGVGETALL